MGFVQALFVSFFCSDFDAEGKVSGVSESRNDVGVIVEDGVHGCDPECDVVFGERLFEVFDAFLCGDCAADVQCFWFSVCEEGFVGEL